MQFFCLRVLIVRQRAVVCVNRPTEQDSWSWHPCRRSRSAQKTEVRKMSYGFEMHCVHRRLFIRSPPTGTSSWIFPTASASGRCFWWINPFRSWQLFASFVRRVVSFGNFSLDRWRIFMPFPHFFGGCGQKAQLGASCYSCSGSSAILHCQSRWSLKTLQYFSSMVCFVVV